MLLDVELDEKWVEHCVLSIGMYIEYSCMLSLSPKVIWTLPPKHWKPAKYLEVWWIKVTFSALKKSNDYFY